MVENHQVHDFLEDTGPHTVECRHENEWSPAPPPLGGSLPLTFNFICASIGSTPLGPLGEPSVCGDPARTLLGAPLALAAGPPGVRHA
jgi:hypothetical protein